ncbi:MAG: BON domain-containing protein [Candidatus Eremiobacteraeota bacterium]|nr:BON domain-containing protein [Candidatus Eremiobacteraeota bacterium]
MPNHTWNVLFLAALALAGCNAGQQREAQQNLNAAATSAPVRAVRDLGLAAAVATKLATIDVDAALTVHVHADAGVVTLEGRAKTLGDKMRFERAVRSLAGVKSVVNLLAIDPHIRGARETFGDAGLTAKIQTSIAAEAGLNVLNISTTAKAGVVTLRGTVPSSSVKETVVSTASHVAGVRRVIDELRIAH